MFWVALFVPLGVGSLVVLGAVTWRLWRQVRRFSRDVAAASDRIGRVSEDLQQRSASMQGR